MSINNARYVLATSCAFALAGCGGGGGGGGGGFTSTPVPAPPPPPPPLTYDFVEIFPSITQDTDFAAIGYEHSGFSGTASDLVGSGFSVRYDAAASAYVIDLPSTPAGRFGASSQDASYWHGLLIDPTGPEPSMSILKPSNPELSFIYTTFGDYYEYEFGGPIFDGIFAFGLATPVAAIPTTGSATYNALLTGNTFSGEGRIGGTATLQFNFALGTLSGSMNPQLIPYSWDAPTIVNLGQYNFVNTIYSVGSTTFSGGLQHSTSNLTGSFNGLFTGPAAQELMARWTAQYLDQSGGGTREMYGVLVGKKP